MGTFFKYRYKTKDLKKGLAGRTSKSESKSKSRAFKSKSKSKFLEHKSKSKSSKNGLKSGLESKSGLEYYKSASQYQTELSSDYHAVYNQRRFFIQTIEPVETTSIPHKAWWKLSWWWAVNVIMLCSSAYGTGYVSVVRECSSNPFLCGYVREWSVFTKVNWSFTVVWRVPTVCWTVAWSSRSQTMALGISDISLTTQTTKSILVCTSALSTVLNLPQRQ